MKSFLRCLTLFIIVPLIFQCAKPNSGIEITNGICIGVIYENDLSFASGALVRLIPSGFDPTAPSSSSVQPESTFTDQNGRYSFTVFETDFYNVIAEKNSASCMLDSVSLLSDIANTIENDTLEHTGWLTGTIEVKRDDNAMLSILLLPGTDIYTSPADSLGTILPIALPVGTHPVTIFTSEIGYEIVDTSIVITSGDTTILNIRIPSSYAPQIESFTLNYDSTLHITTLNWYPSVPLVNGSYALRRIVNGTEDSVIMLSDTIREYSDDCIEFIDDTIVYELSALDDNFKQGYTIATPVLIPSMKHSTVNKILLKNSKYSSTTALQFLVNHYNNIYSFYAFPRPDYNHVLVKLSSDGTQLLEKQGKEICRTGACDSTSIVTFANAFIDSMDNIYVTADPQSNKQLTMYKLDTELNTIKRFDIPRSFLNRRNYSSPRTQNPITVGQDGSIYFHNFQNDSTVIRTYDSDFNYARTDTIDGLFTVKNVFRDTIITISNYHPYTVQLFDRSFTLLSSYEIIDVSTSISSYVFMLSPDLYIAQMFQQENGNSLQGNYIYTLVDKSGKKLVKLGLPSKTQVERLGIGIKIELSFKSIDRIYGLYISPEEPTLYRYNLTTYLNK